MYFWCHPGILCSHGFHKRFLECAYIAFGFWIYDLTENTNYNTMKRFEAFNQWRIRRRNHLLQGTASYDPNFILQTHKAAFTTTLSHPPNLKANTDHLRTVQHLSTSFHHVPYEEWFHQNNAVSLERRRLQINLIQAFKTWKCGFDVFLLSPRTAEYLKGETVVDKWAVHLVKYWILNPPFNFFSPSPTCSFT